MWSNHPDTEKVAFFKKTGNGILRILRKYFGRKYLLLQNTKILSIGVEANITGFFGNSVLATCYFGQNLPK